MGRAFPLATLLAAVTPLLNAQTPSPDTTSAWEAETEAGRVRIEVVARGLVIPWAIAFLPDGRMLVSERRAGRLSLVEPASGRVTPVSGVPPVHAGRDDAGMLDVVLHPDYARNGWIYFCYSAEVPGGTTTVVDRARLEGTSLVGRERLFTAQPAVPNNSHFGARLAFQGGYLFVSLGERDERDRAQDLGQHHGKILRLHDDGRAPSDNPFAGRAGARPEIWSYGHRNPQGLAVHPATGQLWSSEHGPRGGDEVNLIRPGRNYGWPQVSYGREYSGEPVGAGRWEADGLEQPVWYWVPSIAPSGMLFYSGRAFPRWRGSLFTGGMAVRHLNRLDLAGDRVVHEERLLTDRTWRVRSVAEGPDGFLYVGVDAGLLLRIRPIS